MFSAMATIALFAALVDDDQRAADRPCDLDDGTYVVACQRDVGRPDGWFVTPDDTTEVEAPLPRDEIDPPTWWRIR